MKREMHLDTPLLKTTNIGRRDSQTFYFGLTYILGKPSKRAKDDVLKYDNGM